MQYRRLNRAFALWSWLALSCGPAQAEVLWICSLTDDAVRLVCVADIDPHDTVAATDPTRAMVRGTRFPLDPNRQWTVDLWSPPDDLEFVGQLARATICYRSPGCQVNLGMRPGDMASASKLARH